MILMHLSKKVGQEDLVILDLLSVDFMRFCAFLQFLSVFTEEVEAMSPRTCKSRTFCQFNQIIGSGLTACMGFCQHVHINCMCLCITWCACVLCTHLRGSVLLFGGSLFLICDSMKYN